METRTSTTPPRAAGATTEPKVGDRIVMCDVEGLLVADLRASVFAPGYSREDWSYLSDGYLVLDDSAGLVHVASDAKSMPRTAISIRMLLPSPPISATIAVLAGRQFIPLGHCQCQLR